MRNLTLYEDKGLSQTGNNLESLWDSRWPIMNNEINFSDVKINLGIDTIIKQTLEKYWWSNIFGKYVTYCHFPGETLWNF